MNAKETKEKRSTRGRPPTNMPKKKKLKGAKKHKTTCDSVVTTAASSDDAFLTALSNGCMSLGNNGAQLNFFPYATGSASPSPPESSDQLTDYFQQEHHLTPPSAGQDATAFPLNTPSLDELTEFLREVEESQSPPEVPAPIQGSTLTLSRQHSHPDTNHIWTLQQNTACSKIVSRDPRLQKTAGRAIGAHQKDMKRAAEIESNSEDSQSKTIAKPTTREAENKEFCGKNRALTQTLLQNKHINHDRALLICSQKMILFLDEKCDLLSVSQSVDDALLWMQECDKPEIHFLLQSVVTVGLHMDPINVGQKFIRFLTEFTSHTSLPPNQGLEKHLQRLRKITTVGVYSGFFV